jgi:hypothetical protein
MKSKEFSNELEKMFFELCNALEIQDKDPVKYAWLQKNLKNICDKYSATLSASLQKEGFPPDIREEWLQDIQIQAIDIILKLMVTLQSTSESPKRVGIPENSDRYQALQQNSQGLFANMLMLQATSGSVTSATLDSLILSKTATRKELANDRNFTRLLDQMMSKTKSSMSAEIKKLQPGTAVRAAKALLAKVEPFFSALAKAKILEYHAELRDYFAQHVADLTAKGISVEQQQHFFAGLDERLELSRDIHNLTSLQQVLTLLQLNSVEDLLRTAQDADGLTNLLWRKLNTQAAPDAAVTDVLMSDPEILFNVIMKLATDMAGIDRGMDSKQSEKSYYSKHGIKATPAQLHAMYAALMQVLDYDLNTTSERYTELKDLQDEPAHKKLHKKVNYVASADAKELSKTAATKLENDAVKSYNEMLINLADYTDVVQEIALVVAGAKNKKTPGMVKMQEWAAEMATISKQLRAAHPFKGATITDRNIRTLVELAAKTIETSQKVEQQYKVVNSNGGAWFAAQNYRIITMITNGLSALINNVQKILGWQRQPAIHPSTIAKVETMQQKLLRDAQNLRSNQ